MQKLDSHPWEDTVPEFLGVRAISTDAGVPRPPASAGRGLASTVRRPLLVAAVAAVAVLAAAAEAGDYKIVANPSITVSSLSRATVSSYFLKKVDHWPDGTPVVPVDQAPGSPARESFTREIHEKSAEMINAYWQKQVFSGRAAPPPAKASDAEVLAYVRSAPGAIGYVSAGASTSGVKEIRLE
jgi:hypothetical protein